MNKTDIEYLDYTWNPLAMRCSPVSEGCANCWHLKFANRHAHNPQFSQEMRAAYAGGEPYLREDELKAPFKLKKPSRVGVQFMGDLFHKKITQNNRMEVFWHILQAKQHKYFCLTKRASDMLWFFNQIWISERNYRMEHLKYVFFGISASNQEDFNQQAKELGRLKAISPHVKTFVSLEPLLASIDIIKPFWGTLHGIKLIDLVIVGGESGPGARPLHPDWARSVRDQCVEAGVAYFFKQWGEWKPFKGGEHIRDKDGKPIKKFWTEYLKPNEMKVLIDNTWYDWYDIRTDKVKIDSSKIDGWLLTKIGKKAAGRELDGKIYNEFPEVM